MIDALKFVQRGVARKDIIPGLTHFKIQAGRVTGFNGTVTLSAPVDIGFDCAPAAAAFIRALNACETTISLKLDGLKLTVRSGNFRTVVPCIPLDQVPDSLPEGRMYQPPGSLLKAFETLEPFIGFDASRPWACGILLNQQSAIATNNIILVQYWLGCDLPRVNIPSSAVEEILRIKEEMTGAQISDTNITFHYADGRWVKSQLYEADGWPDILGLLDNACATAAPQPIPPGLLEAVEKIGQFNDKHDVRCYMRRSEVSTDISGLETNGALVEIAGAPDKCCFHTQMIAKVLRVADLVDWSLYPKPVPFFGSTVRGVIVGIRVDYAS